MSLLILQKKNHFCLLKCFSGECRVFSKAIEFLSPTEMLADCWNSMALAFLTFPQIQEPNDSFRTYISLEKLLEESG